MPLIEERSRTTTVTSHRDDSRSTASGKYQDPRKTTTLNTIGIESDDIINCAKYITGRMLANPTINNAGGTPRTVIMDSKYFTVRCNSRFDKDTLIDSLRVEMVTAANGRIRFISRERAAVVEEERDLQEEGVVGKGTIPDSAHQLKADYRLTGRITNLAENQGSVIQNYILMVFEMMDASTAEIVFSDKWESKKQKTVPRVYN